MYLDDENPELENRILQQDFSDLRNQYDDGQLEKILSNQHSVGRKYPDLNEYNLPDYQNDGQLYSPYYMQQNNLGSERFYPLDYRQAPERYAVVKKPRTKKINSWVGHNSLLQQGRPNYSLHESARKRRQRRVNNSRASRIFNTEELGMHLKFCFKKTFYCLSQLTNDIFNLAYNLYWNF